MNDNFLHQKIKINTETINCHREQVLADRIYEWVKVNGLPKYFDTWSDSKLIIDFNPNSGFVYLWDEDSVSTASFNEDKLERFFTCYECGREGFLNEFDDINKDSCCYEFVGDYIKQEVIDEVIE